LPNNTKYEEFTNIINELPDQDNPSLFMLPGNIERTLQITNSNKVIGQLRILNITLSEGQRFNREKWSSELSPLIGVWNKLISNNQAILDWKAKQVSDSASPVDAFVYMEAEKAHSLIKLINSEMIQLGKVINGSMLLSPKIAVLGTSLLKAQVPDRWSDAWEGPSDPYAWLNGLISRGTALEKWVERVDQNAILSSPLDLGELIRPETFLNALRQQTARLAKCAVDALKLISSPDPKLLSSCKVPVTLSGLLLQGCSFDGGKLSDVLPDSPSNVSLGSITLGFVPQQEPDPYPASSTIATPIYYSSSRERFIGEISLPCVGERTRALLTGVALFLNE
jgi:dynein heavy chain 2